MENFTGNWTFWYLIYDKKMAFWSILIFQDFLMLDLEDGTKKPFWIFEFSIYQLKSHQKCTQKAPQRSYWVHIADFSDIWVLIWSALE